MYFFAITSFFLFQTVISESRINFECNLKKSKQSLNSRIEFLQAKLAEIETLGQESLDQLEQSRRILNKLIWQSPRISGKN